MTRLQRLSLRGRLMLIGITGLLVALTVAAFVLYAVLVWTVDRTLDNDARATARIVVQFIEEDRLPRPIPGSGAQVIQVIDDQNRVVAGSLTADRLTPLLRSGELGRVLAGEAVMVSGARVARSGTLRVVAEPAATPGGRQTVIVALAVDDVLNSRRIVRNALLVTVPLLVAMLGVIAWRVIGSTLRPVDVLRRGAERISGANRAERLPVPPAADEIRALAETLNTMLDRLAAARARQQAFVADAAHELRSPIASMRTQLEVAEHLGEGGDLPRELLTDIARLTGLVEDLLLLARADADIRAPAATSPFDGGALLREVAEAYETASVQVVVSDESEFEVVGDRGELRRVLVNLCDNAVRHAESYVRLSHSSEGDWMVLTVTDDGPGVPEADRQRVFDRFTRLDEARTRDAGGTGLGLAIAQELVHRAGGHISLTGGVGAFTAEVRLAVDRTSR